jgi:hypothetical protein
LKEAAESRPRSTALRIKMEFNRENTAREAEMESASLLFVSRMMISYGNVNFSVYSCSQLKSSFTAIFTEMKLSECVWEEYTSPDHV